MIGSVNDCLTPGSGPVLLEVRAFASSSGTAEANLKLAQDRALEVKQLLDEAAAELLRQPERLEVRLFSWTSFEQMDGQRLFNDQPSGEAYSERAGRLNRRAEIRLLDAAGCGF